MVVAAVVVNWNGADLLEDCLPSLRAQDYKLEIVVVDNGSHDESEKVVLGHPGVRWLPLGENRGLAAALNEGARVTGGEYVLFLNNDMDFAPDFVSRLVEALEAHPEAFSVDAQQFGWDNGAIEHCRTELRRGRWFSLPIPGYDIAQAETTTVTTCMFGSAANLLVRRERFEALGGWHAGYPAGIEDVDLAMCAWMRGWPSLFVPEAHCRHRISATSRTAQGANARMRGTLIGHLRFAIRHLPAPEALTAIALTLGPAIKDLVYGRWGQLRMRADAAVTVTHDFGQLMADRSVFRRVSGLSARDRLRQLAAATGP